jgi:hypothetical protein
MKLSIMIGATPRSFSLKPVMPIYYRGLCFSDYRLLYRASPRKPSVTIGGFRSRLIRYYRLWGDLDEVAVEHCLFDRNHKFDIGGIVYMIRQQSTGLRYYGITDSLLCRMRAHVNYSTNSNAHLHRQIKTCGIVDFDVHEVAKVYDRRTLLDLERHLILSRNTLWPCGLNAV